MAAALPFVAAAGSIVQGIGSFKAANANARRLNEQATEEQRGAAAQIRQTRDEGRAVIGEQLTAQVSGGLAGGTGTALDALRQSQIEIALDVMELRRQGDLKARSLQQQASDVKREGRFALLSGVLGAGSSFVKQRNDFAQERLADGGSGGG